MIDIGSLTGSIEIEDQVTGVLGHIMDAVETFAGEFGGVFGFAAKAAVAATAAVTGLTAAITALGAHGSDVADVETTFEHFTGGVDEAAAVMKKLQDGTLGTVEKFDLMKSSSKLLAAGVKLTADNFGTLSQAAFVLQNQGLGPTTQMLNLVSQAMLTGRTRQLEMTIGRLNLKAAEEAYAASLGKTRKDLDDVEKVEAKRQGILDALAKKVKEAGVQHRDFGEQLEFIQAKVKDWIDDIAVAVSKSEGLGNAMEILTGAISDAFGGDQTKLIEGVVSAVEGASIVVVDIGLGFVEMARVAVTAWAAVKLAVLGSMDLIVERLATTQHYLAGILGVMSLLPNASGEIRAAANAASAAAKELDTMSAGLRIEVAEAMRGVTGNSELHKTLDKVGGTLFRMKDALENAKKAQDAHSGAVKKHTDELEHGEHELTEYEKKLKKVSDALSGKDAIDAAKEYEEVLKGIPDISLLTTEAQKKIAKTMQEAIDVYTAAGTKVPKAWKDIRDAAVAASSATAAGIDQTTAALAKYGDSLKITRALWKGMNEMEDPTWAFRSSLKGRNLSGFVAQVGAAPGDMGLSPDWDVINKNTNAALQNMRDQARNTYNYMVANSGDFSKSTIRHFKEVADEADRAFKGVGKSLGAALFDDLQRIPGMVVSALTGGGGIGGALQGVGSMLGATLGKSIGAGISSLGKFGGPIGEAIGSLAGPLIGKIVDIFGTAGRDAIKAFGKQLTGSTDLNALHDLLTKQLPADAEKYWIILTQGTGRNNAAQAAANIKLVQDALANSPSALASAAGYKTLAELQTLADQAKAVYDYMAASGKYSAEAIADAFQKSKDAQIAALGDTAKAQQDELEAIKTKYKTSIDEIDAKYKALSDSVAGEAEEQYMGIVEANARAEMKKLEDQKKAVEAARDAEISAKEAAWDEVYKAGKQVDDDLRELFKNPYKMRGEFTVDNPPPGYKPNAPSSSVPSVPSGRAGSINFKLNMNGRTVAREVIPYLSDEVELHV